MGGNAKPNVSPGTPGEVSIVLQGPLMTTPYGPGTNVLVVVENDTDSPISAVQVSGPASVNGTVVGSGTNLLESFYPTGTIGPGQLTFSSVYFSAALPSNAKLQLTPTYHKGASAYFVDVQVIQANQGAGVYGNGAIVGTVQNTSSVSVTGPIAADVFCFDASGNPTGTATGYVAGTSNAPLPAGATTSYEIDFAAPTNCPTYLVGSSGFNS
jgi:hypothetical protein